MQGTNERVCDWVPAPLPTTFRLAFQATPSSPGLAEPCATGPEVGQSLSVPAGRADRKPRRRWGCLRSSQQLLSQSERGHNEDRQGMPWCWASATLIPCQPKLPYRAYSTGRGSSKAPAAPTAAEATRPGIRAVPASSASAHISAELRK